MKWLSSDCKVTSSLLKYLPMAMLCDYCRKGIMYGNKVSHAKNRSKRTWKPNLHKKRVVLVGRAMNLKLCTKCIRFFAKAALALKEQKEQKEQVSTIPTAAA